MGVGHVIESYRQKNLYNLLFTSVACKLVNDHDSDIYFYVKRGNTVPENHVQKLGTQVFDAQRWIAVSNRKSLGSHL